ncbi:cilium assembly protein DZIP1 isoform X2 [Pocillopora verrucosa]|uniref:cilium assembly protein DZIP1 isoform X2 n=1 Tax=Pocillopora verrucosa TaxID=203993 RepID=UPI0033419293
MAEGMNFSFGRRQEKIDWRRLASVDVDRILREMDVKTLQDNIMHVTFSNIEAELGMQAIGFDPNYIKLFRLAQLIIEYLLHSQQFLSANLEAENKTLQESLETTERVKKELDGKKEAYKKLKKECQKQKQWIAEYQLLIRAGASGSHKCPYCAKSFVSHEYVIAHLSRRHGEHTSQVNGMVISTVPPVKSVGAVTMETKPGMTEKEKNDLEEELQMIKLRLQKTERELQEEKKLTQSQRDKLTTENHNMDELRAMFDQWKAGEKAEQQREIAELKRTFVQDMNSMREERDMFSDRVTALQEQLNSQKKTSMIGSIIDEDETDSPAKANRSEMSQQFMAQLEDKVIQMQTETQQNLQKEMQKMHQKFKAREDKSKKEHREEMGQFQEMMGQYEENLQNERIEKKRMSEDYESKIGGLQREVQELRNALDAQKVETEKVQYSFKTQPPPLLASTPPVPAPRHIEKPVQAEPPERERATSPDKSIKTGAESITLYVATNQKKSGQYRLWRQTADGSNEWSNKYALSAFIKPTGNFTYPVYVFAAGGSPHWRQYVSDKSSPPSPEYRLDYMFYCSQTFLPGTLQYHVLEAGSVPVIRSYVSRTNSVPGWRHNGLSFYAPKSTLVSDKTLTSISASFESTLTEDKEQDFEPSESESEEESPVPVVPKVEVEDVDANDSTGSYDDVREITSGLSSSEWGTTTLETVEFHPIPHNRLITTRFNHKFDEVQACRQEIAQILDQKLSKQGLSSENPRLSSQKMEAKMAALRTERQARSKKIKNFTAVRQRCVEMLEEIVKKTYRSGTSTGKPGSSVPAGPGSDYRSHKDKPPTFKSTATAVRTSTSLQQGRKSPASRGTLVSTGSTSGGDMTVSVTSVTDGSFSGTSVVTERTLSESEEEVSVTEGSQEEDQEEDEEESNWDSEEEAVKPPTQPTHKVAVHIPSQQDEESDSDIEEVRELTETLERSLNFGSAVKKPAGGVSLHFQGNGNDNSEPPRATAQQSSGRKNDDDFDSDLSISSLEEKTPGRGKFDSGRRNLQPPGGSQSTGRQSPVLEFRRPQPQSTRIQAFTHDDFSDIEDD